MLQSDAKGSLQGSPDVLTDGYRKREMAFGRIGDDSSSQTMAADEPYVAPRPVHDYWPVPPDGTQTVVRYTGITGVRSVVLGRLRVRCSETKPCARAVERSGRRPGDLLVDRSFGHAVGQWIEVRLPHTTTVAGLRLRLASGSAGVTQVRVDVSEGLVSGSRLASVRPDSQELQPLAVTGGLSGKTSGSR